MKKKEQLNSIVFQDGVVGFDPDLPFPYVHYPGHYGAFIGFSISKEDPVCFCDCSKQAIINYIKFRAIIKEPNNSNQHKNFILSCHDFPISVVDYLMNQQNMETSKIFSNLLFKSKICHECNKTTPKFNYCHSMYGGVFEQNYGWYINKQSYSFGVKPNSFKIIDEICADKVFSLVESERNFFLENYNTLSNAEMIVAKVQDSKFRKITRKIRNAIENEVRVKFGYKKIGESWLNETLLYKFIRELLPNEKIIRNYRPHYLNFLELDIYVPNIKLAIEYQGIQHYKPIDHWGGKKSLKKVKQRDILKLELCKENNIKLIYFYYYDEITKELVQRRMKPYL